MNKLLILMVLSSLILPLSATNINKCTNLTAPGTYVMTGDILLSTNLTCMTVSANNVILDCGGHTISGTAQYNSYAVYGGTPYVNGYNNFVIRNCRITNWYYGIYLWSSNYSTIANITADGNYDTVTLYLSNYDTITNVNASNGIAISYNSGPNGLYMSGSNNDVVTNFISNNEAGPTTWGSGFNIGSSNYDTFINCTADSGGFGMQNINYDTFINCSTSNNYPWVYQGFWVDMADSDSFINFTLSQNIYAFDAYYLTNSNLSGFTLTSNEIGIELGASSNNLISGSTFSYNTVYSLYLEYGDSNNIVTNCVFNNNNDGFWVDRSSYTLITNSQITNNNQVGAFFGGSHITISNSVMTNNNYGLAFYGTYGYISDSNTIANNTISGSTGSGTYGISLGNATNFNIYNNLLNNTLDVSIYYPNSNNFNTTNHSGTRIYSQGNNIGGNYWTNQYGTGYSDTCSVTYTDINNRFCDQPYDVLNENGCTPGSCGPNTDYLPLTTPYSLAMVISQYAPPNNTINFSRTITYNYSVSWSSISSTPVNCSLFDNSSGVLMYSGVRNNTPINNNTVYSFNQTYTSDYSPLGWAVKCCNAYGYCRLSQIWTLYIHTSTINASAPLQQCLNGPAFFYCNYTDGNNVSINGATVNITVWNNAEQFIYTNDPTLVGVPNVVPNSVSYDNAAKQYYVDLSTVASRPDTPGSYNYSCSANSTAYPSNSTGNYTSGFLPLYPTYLNVNTTPTYTVPQPYGSHVLFQGDYRNASDNSKLTGATCALSIWGVTYQPHYNASSGYYENVTNPLWQGPNPCVFNCTQPCYATATNTTNYVITYGGLPSSPALVFEDPVYSQRTNATFHRVINALPMSNLVVNISESTNGWNWTYGMVTKLDTPHCSDLQSLNTSRILLVRNSTYINDTEDGCVGLNPDSFAGVIFQDDVCGRVAPHICNLTVPYAYNFSSDAYDAISNNSYVLLDGENKVVDDISGLRNFYFNGYYIESDFAPDFLMRLRGQFTPSPYGIESIVSVSKFTNVRSSIDYYYFNPNLNPMIYRIKGMPNCENSSICSNNSIPHFYMDNQTGLTNTTGTFTNLQVYNTNSLILNPQSSPGCPAYPFCNSSCACTSNLTFCSSGSCQYIGCSTGSDCTSFCALHFGGCAIPKCDTSSSPHVCVCGTTQTNCISGDNCCPAGCTYKNDSDCPYAPPGPSGCIGVCNPAVGDNTANCPYLCCKGDCTGTVVGGGSDNTCHTECAGVNGCSASTPPVCNNQLINTIACANASGYSDSAPKLTYAVRCCNNTLQSCPAGDYCLGAVGCVGGTRCGPNVVCYSAPLPGPGHEPEPLSTCCTDCPSYPICTQPDPNGKYVCVPYWYSSCDIPGDGLDIPLCEEYCEHWG